MNGKSPRKIPESHIKEYMQVYEAFSDRLSREAFVSLIENINWEDGNFLRASSIFLLSKKCVQCERTLALALLCSSIEVMTPKESQIDFFSWLVKNKLDGLVMKNKSEIKDTLDLVHKEWREQPQREGAFHSFKQFLLDYCPEDLRITPPVKSSKEDKLSFELVLQYIYGKFRSLFLREGLSYASYDTTNADNFSISHVMLVGKHLYFIGFAFSFLVLNVSFMPSKFLEICLSESTTSLSPKLGSSRIYSLSCPFKTLAHAEQMLTSKKRKLSQSLLFS